MSQNLALFSAYDVIRKQSDKSHQFSRGWKKVGIGFKPPAFRGRPRHLAHPLSVIASGWLRSEGQVLEINLLVHIYNTSPAGSGG